MLHSKTYASKVLWRFELNLFPYSSNLNLRKIRRDRAKEKRSSSKFNWFITMALVLTVRFLRTVKSGSCHPRMPWWIIPRLLVTWAFSLWIAFAWPPFRSVKLVWVQNVFDSEWCHCVSCFLSGVVFRARNVLRVLCITAQAPSTPGIDERIYRKAITTLHHAKFWTRCALQMHSGDLSCAVRW